MGKLGESVTWWRKEDGTNSERKGYTDYKADSFEFKEEKEDGKEYEYRGERSEWKQYDDNRYYNKDEEDSGKEWCDCDYAGKDSEWSNADKEWGFDKEKWETSMGESTDNSKWEEDKYQGEPSEKYQEDYKGKETEYKNYDGDNKKIKLSSYKNNEDNFVVNFDRYFLVQHHVKTNPNNKSRVKQKKYYCPPLDMDDPREMEGNGEKNTIESEVHSFVVSPQNKVTTKNNDKQQDEWVIHENPYRHFIKPEKEDYAGVNVIWIIVFVALLAVRYYSAIRRIVKFIRLLGR